MGKKTATLLPSSERRLQRFGERLRLARLRRRLTGKQVAERAGMTPVTLRSLEKGSSGVTIGAYLAVMQVLGTEADIDLLAADDVLGRTIQDASLAPSHRRAKAIGHSDAVTLDVSPLPSASPEKSGDRSTDDDTFISSDTLAALIDIPAMRKKGPGHGR